MRAVTAAAVLDPPPVPPSCVPFATGSSATAPVLPLRVRSLGLPSTQDLPLPLPVTVTAASPACT